MRNVTLCNYTLSRKLFWEGQAVRACPDRSRRAPQSRKKSGLSCTYVQEFRIFALYSPMSLQ